MSRERDARIARVWRWWPLISRLHAAGYVITTMGALGFVSAIFAPGAIRWTLMSRVVLPMGILGLALTGSALLAATIISGWTYRQMKKRYPLGCTCIRGAMTDNPSCPIPEHRSTL